MPSSNGLPGYGPMPVANVYNGNNQNPNMSYDAAGNQTGLGGVSLSYDAENRQTLATNTLSGGSASYQYDGLGERVLKSMSSQTTVYVYDAFGQLASEFNSQAAWPACETCYLSYDHLGTVRMLTDQNGNVVARHDFAPFGQEVPAGYSGRGVLFGSTTDIDPKFTAQIRDTETGEDFFNARYFYGQLTRFLNVDPGNAGADPTDPQTWNGYSYVRNSPMNAVDPSGMDAINCGIGGNLCSSTPPGSQGVSIDGAPPISGQLARDLLGGGESYAQCPGKVCGIQTPQGLYQFNSYANGLSGYVPFGLQPYEVQETLFGQTYTSYGNIVLASAPEGGDGNPLPPSQSSGNQQRTDVPLNDYAQALFSHPRLGRTARVMTNPCTYAAWTGAAAAAGAGGVAVAHGGEIVAAVSDNSATLIHKALTWWFNFTGRPPSGAMKAATLTAPVVAGALAKACSSF